MSKKAIWVIFSLLLACSEEAQRAADSDPGTEDTETGTEGDTDESIDSDGDSDSDSDSDTGTSSDTDSDTDIDGDADTGTDADSDTGTDTGSETDTGSDVDSDSDTDGDTDSDSDSDSDTGTDTGAIDTDSDADTDTGTDTGTETTTDTETSSDSDTDTGTETGTDTGTDTDTNTETETVTETDTGSDTDTDTGSLCDGAPEIDGAWCDPTTGYLWEVAEHWPPKNWVTEYNRCAGLTIDGYAGWELPSIEELQSLLRAQGPLGCYWDESVFGDVCWKTYYWSAPIDMSATSAQVVDFQTGATYSFAKTQTAGIARCRKPWN